MAMIPQGLSYLGPDLFSSLATLHTGPLGVIRRHKLFRAQASKWFGTTNGATRSKVGARSSQGDENTHALQDVPYTRLPDCLSTAPIAALGLVPSTLNVADSLSIWMPKASAGLLLLNHSHARPASSRHLPASTRAFATLRGNLTVSSHKASVPQRRSFPIFHNLFRNGLDRSISSTRSFSTSRTLANQNVLAHTERTANNNPTSASAQNAFYSALLRSNLPKLVIERYETGRYASNPAVDGAYLKALQMTGSVPAPGAGSLQGSGHGLSQDRLQAVGQAIAGQVKGGQMVKPGNTNGTGAKDTPLYVVVEESWGSTILKWVKTFLWVGLAGYFLLVVLTMVVEMTGNFRTRASQNNEVQPQHQTVRFSDVHGCDEAKEELQELVEFLLNPDRFNQLGGKLPKGVLLVGPPGTGKTMLARAVAGEAGCPVFYMSGSEFDELYVGVGAKRVRELFAQARAKSPSIIFIDELDAVGGKRNARDPAYAKQTLNQLLTELDGFSPSTGVILIAATNYPESLDKALTRPGRFDRHVTVPLPDVRGRIQILKHHMKNVPMAGDVDVANLARASSGFSGADLENLVNQAAVHASRLKYKKVNAQNFEWAKDKIMMGAEAKSRMIREKDKIMTAYHEAGHCLVNLFTPSSDQLYKMTIVPRGHALGVTHMLPEMDAVSRGYDQYLASIDVSMGGRAAEELIYGSGKVSSGISSDVQSATNIAKYLVMTCGYSPKLGNVDYQSDYNKLSSETKALIEQEVRDIVEAGRQRADAILKEKRKELEALKDALLEFETLDRAEIEKIMRGEKLKRIEVELREEPSSGNDNPKGNNPQGVRPPKETSSKGGVGIKLPEVLLPPGAGSRSGEKGNARTGNGSIP